MKKIILGSLFVFGLFFVIRLEAYEVGPERASGRQRLGHYRAECNTAQAQTIQGVNHYLTDLTGVYTKINNVRAYLLTGGDLWWDRDNAGYIVPHPNDPNEQGVSSIFAAGLWLGGIDAAGNLKTACQMYGNTTGDSDFWAGPLDLYGETEAGTCANWDRFFEVTAVEIDLHKTLFEAAANGIPYEASDIPPGVKGWPARGNPFFEDLYGFSLPSTDQGLAEFWDENGDDLYNPLDGDYPILSYRGCDGPKYADQMIFWIYNDHGSNVHEETLGTPLKVEIQALAFSFGTEDALNDMTFQRHKIISRSAEPLDSLFFGLWLDPDLGCYSDDYIGCDSSRSLAYVYNADEVDGESNSDCAGGIPTYGEEIPIIGIDYFRGPLKITADTVNGEIIFDTVDLEMTSFMYYNSGGVVDPPLGMMVPNTPQGFYNYLTAHWNDGSPLYYGGNGYMEFNSYPVHFAFTSAPDEPDGWSMCEENLGGQDRRMIISSGPGLLHPGEMGEMIFGLPWVANQAYPCPDLSQLFAADEMAQEAFDNCFEMYVSTGTKEVLGGEGPLAELRLYPNPVYSISGMGPVLSGLPAVCDVSVYTSTGLLLHRHHSEQEAGGLWQWDMKDASGRRVLPGLYLIRVKTRAKEQRVLKCLVY